MWPPSGHWPRLAPAIDAASLDVGISEDREALRHLGVLDALGGDAEVQSVPEIDNRTKDLAVEFAVSETSDQRIVELDLLDGNLRSLMGDE